MIRLPKCRQIADRLRRVAAARHRLPPIWIDHAVNALLRPFGLIMWRHYKGDPLGEEGPPRPLRFSGWSFGWRHS